jgi:Flp pilus assembly protein CpaB
MSRKFLFRAFVIVVVIAAAMYLYMTNQNNEPVMTPVIPTAENTVSNTVEDTDDQTDDQVIEVETLLTEYELYSKFFDDDFVNINRVEPLVGYEAIVIPVSNFSSLNPHLLPNLYIDVLSTNTALGKTEFLATNVRILSIDSLTVDKLDMLSYYLRNGDENEVESTKAILSNYVSLGVSSTLTLELGTYDTVQLQHAIDMGYPISISVRNQEDEKLYYTTYNPYN